MEPIKTATSYLKQRPLNENDWFCMPYHVVDSCGVLLCVFSVMYILQYFKGSSYRPLHSVIPSPAVLACLIAAFVITLISEVGTVKTMSYIIKKVFADEIDCDVDLKKCFWNCIPPLLKTSSYIYHIIVLWLMNSVLC